MNKRILPFTVSAAASVGLLFSGCKKEEPYPPARYAPYGTAPSDAYVSYPPYPGTTTTAPPATAPPAATPPATTPPATTPTSTVPPTNMAPAYGFPCASDSDTQCLFGRCLQGRCGGCTDVSQCKPGAVCAPTPFGLACVWSGDAPPPTNTSVPPQPTTPPQPPSTDDPFERARALCVNKTNAYRASVGSAPAKRRADQEACGDRQAATDAATGRAHGAFGQCSERAQNECPGWPGPPEAMIDRCLQMMFDEGPGEGPAHGHYANIVNTNHRGVSCSFYAKSDGSVWMVQNFYP